MNPMKKAMALLIALSFLAIISCSNNVSDAEMAINHRADRLNAEITIQHWAEHLIAQEGIGRNCAVVNYSDVKAIFESRGQKRLEKDVGILDYADVCWKEMKLSELTYFADYNAVSGVYRCEKNELIQELQLTIRMEPRSVPQKDDCKVGTFPKAWNLPVGEATMFGLP
jgi:hypothetical protein